MTFYHHPAEITGTNLFQVNKMKDLFWTIILMGPKIKQESDMNQLIFVLNQKF